MSTNDFLEKDYYKALGVSKSASADEIKQAYRKLARKYHPDANKGDRSAEERFKEISEAYNTLSDEKKRKEYDEARSLFGGGFRVPGAGGRGGPPGTARTAGGGPCRGCHGTGARAGTMPKVCPTCQGSGQTTRTMGNTSVPETCRTCGGRGLVVEDPCPTCSGSGRAMSTRTIQARIPAGVADGQRVKLRGKGAPGEHGGPAGHPVVRAHVTTTPALGRSPLHLAVTRPLTRP